MGDPRDDLTPRQVAEQLGVTVRTVQRWIADGSLPSVPVGARRRVPRSALGQPADPGQTGSRPIRSLLIANRGEIATRIARTARHLGIRVVRVHAPDESVPEADQVLPIPDYLDGPALIDAALRAGADAIHPGYGFLAENPAFATAVTAAGLTWIGPPAAAISAMGDKAAARQLAVNLGVAVVPGFDDVDADDATLAVASDQVGFPLLIKPAAGGGGKGMRIVRHPDELPDQLSASRREALAAFGDDRLILERALEGPRHVEVQVLMDRFGAGVHLGERDCSAQRRNQKIVEEAPGPAVDAALRSRLGIAALRLAEAVGYEGAGTVEFLLTDDGQFFFLEMNTRLQVEHPVTEAVTGRDLVADQIRIAAGEPLGFGQSDVHFNGHAIEARLYAEDPENGFLPATGWLLRVQWPDGLRVDSGVAVGDEVGGRYDPLLAKIIAHGPTRPAALGRLRDGLAATEVLGVRTNLRFLRWLLDQPAMASGEVRTDSLARLILPGPIEPPEAAWSAAAAALVRVGGAWDGGWRANSPPVIRLTADAETRAVEPRPGPTVVVSGGRAHVDVEGQSLEFALAPPPTVEGAVRQAAAHGSDVATLRAPMPGRVASVSARPGDSVAAHQTLIVLEAMKMEHAVATPIDGVVTEVGVVVGQLVQRGDRLAEIDRGEPPPRIDE
jgi:acetyl-CoA/propionyl-CoA carboxylase biotin carboxyl carrier protein